MPEVVEVYTQMKYIELNFLGKVLKNVIPIRGKYTINKIQGLNLLSGYVLNNIGSKGKFMWVEFKKNNNMKYMFVSLGLTGGWTLNKDKYSNIEFDFGKKLYFDDKIGFGTIKLATSSELLIKLNKLAPDALTRNFTCNDIINKINNYKKNIPIVTLLMDQTGIVSGIGNYLSAEILYNAKIDPHSLIKNLNNTIINKLCKSIKYITKLTFLKGDLNYLIETNDFIKELKIIRKINFHNDIKINNQPYKLQVYGLTLDSKNNEIITSSIIKGRKTYWCPTIQKTY